jgi:hypothetical protein
MYKKYIVLILLFFIFSFLNISYADFSNFSDYKKDCYELIKSEYNNKNLENYVYNYSYNETSD